VKLDLGEQRGKVTFPTPRDKKVTGSVGETSIECPSDIGIAKDEKMAELFAVQIKKSVSYHIAFSASRGTIWIFHVEHPQHASHTRNKIPAA
jgi:hypothetical protein